MGDSITLEITPQHTLGIHCMHGRVVFSVRHWERGEFFAGDVSIPWGVWREVVELAKPEGTSGELLVGEPVRAYTSIAPSEAGVTLEASGESRGLFVEFLVPWDAWEKAVKWIEGPGKASVAAHSPGIVEKQERFEIRKLSIK